jgi:hypothetical protein
MILFDFSPQKGSEVLKSSLPFEFTNHKDCQSISSLQRRSPSQDTVVSLKDSHALKSPC